MFKGCFVAMATPFREGKIDEEALRRLIDFLIDSGVDGLVPCGTTGESPTLSFEEHKWVIRTTLEHNRGRVSVIAGTGSNSTQEAIELTEYARDAGASGALVITPYYNKPTQQGLEAHFQAIDKIGLPIVIYNVPSRTGVSIAAATVARLSQLDHICGIKEASGDMDHVSALVEQCGPKFSVLSGNDSHTLPILALGGTGVISVIANILPEPMTNMVRAFLSGDAGRARELHQELFPLCRAMFLETNPIPVKTAMARLGMISAEWRLPLTPMTQTHEQTLEQEMKAYGLLLRPEDS